MQPSTILRPTFLPGTIHMTAQPFQPVIPPHIAPSQPAQASVAPPTTTQALPTQLATALPTTAAPPAANARPAALPLQHQAEVPAAEIVSKGKNKTYRGVRQRPCALYLLCQYGTALPDVTKLYGKDSCTPIAYRTLLGWHTLKYSLVRSKPFPFDYQTHHVKPLTSAAGGANGQQRFGCAHCML